MTFVKMKCRSHWMLLLIASLMNFSFYSGGENKLGIRTVVIDAGHGGKDPGCLGSGDLQEKHIALAISLKLGKYIEENFKDIKVIYTRTEDVFVKLHERANIANRNKADLFICIHVNSSVSSKSYGTETFVMGQSKTEANMRAVQRENATILMEDDYKEKYENFDPNDPESYIAFSLVQNAFLDQSIEFASKVQTQFKERVGRHDRGVREAPFLVLHQTTMPSVLIETGFLTNKEEEKFLTSEIGQDYMASAIYRAFKQYKLGIDKKIKDSFNEAQAIKEEVNKRNNPGLKGLEFRVQIATSANKIELSPENFNGLSNVNFYEAGGLYRYTYGNAATRDHALQLQDEVKQKGYVDAFIVAFLDGKRISVGEAVKLIQ